MSTYSDSTCGPQVHKNNKHLIILYSIALVEVIREKVDVWQNQSGRNQQSWSQEQRKKYFVHSKQVSWILAHHKINWSWKVSHRYHWVINIYSGFIAW